MSIDRCLVKETLTQSIQRLQDKIRDTIADSNAKHHLSAVLEAGKFILANGPIVKTRDAGNVYLQSKGLAGTIYTSIELYEILCKHLSVSQVYIFSQAYLVQNSPGSNLTTVVKSLNQILDKDVIVKEITEQKLKDLLLPCQVHGHS